MNEEIDLIITNVIIDMARVGDISDAFQNKDIKLKEIALELTIFPSSGESFPADIVLFSRKRNYYLVLEMKLTATTSLNTTQANGYSTIDVKTSFKDIFSPNPETSQQDVGYITESEFYLHVKSELSANGYSFPTLCFDKENFILSIDKNDHDLSDKKINSLFINKIQLNVDSLDKVPRHINFCPSTPHHKIASSIITSLIGICERHPETFIKTSEICRDSISNYSFLWERMDRRYRREVESIVNRTLRALVSRGVEDLIYESGGWIVDIFDINGKISVPKYSKLKEQLDSAIEEMRQAPALFEGY